MSESITEELRDCIFDCPHLKGVADRIDARFDRELQAKHGEVDGLKAYVDDLQARLDASIPLPLDADGVPTTIGDTIFWTDAPLGEDTRCHGNVIGFVVNGHGVIAPRVTGGREPSMWTHFAPEPPDSQERIDADARKTSCEYFERSGKTCVGCPAEDVVYTLGDCLRKQMSDLLRRQRELDGAGE